MYRVWGTIRVYDLGNSGYRHTLKYKSFLTFKSYILLLWRQVVAISGGSK